MLYRSSQDAGHAKWKWLYYAYEGVQGPEDVCKIKSAEYTFVTRGVQNCRMLATTVFRQHELNDFHKEQTNE